MISELTTHANPDEAIAFLHILVCHDVLFSCFELVCNHSLVFMRNIVLKMLQFHTELKIEKRVSPWERAA